jgi:hypothetical protein
MRFYPGCFPNFGTKLNYSDMVLLLMLGNVFFSCREISTKPKYNLNEKKSDHLNIDNQTSTTKNYGNRTTTALINIAKTTVRNEHQQTKKQWP